jgi:hypothetical protein
MLDAEEVRGSNPLAPTSETAGQGLYTVQMGQSTISRAGHKLRTSRLDWEAAHGQEMHLLR